MGAAEQAKTTIWHVMKYDKVTAVTSTGSRQQQLHHLNHRSRVSDQRESDILCTLSSGLDIDGAASIQYVLKTTLASLHQHTKQLLGALSQQRAPKLAN